MLPQRTLQYLAFLLLFIMMYRCAAATTLPAHQISTTPTPLSATADSKGSAKTPEEARSKHDTLKRAVANCNREFSWICLKVEFVKLMESLSERDELRLLPGVTVVKDYNAATAKTVELMAEVARSYPNDPDARLNGFIVSRLSNFLHSHSIRLRLIDATTMAEARSALTGTGRKGKFGKKGGMEAIIAAGLMMKGTLMALGMGAVALMAGKALMTALMALTLSGVLGLKALAGGGGKSTTYEIVTKPIYTSSHSHSVSHDDGHAAAHSGHYSSGHTGGSGYGGYARALNLNLELPKQLETPLVVQ